MRVILQDEDVRKWLRFFINRPEDEWKVVRPVRVPPIEGQDGLRCGHPSETAVKVEALVNNSEQACLMTRSQDGMARADGQVSLISDFPIEAPNRMVAMHFYVLEIRHHVWKLRRIQFLVGDASR